MNHNTKGRVLIAMSGGVDSSVAAMLLADEGYDVIGVSMNLLTCNSTDPSSCCTPSDRRDAADVCRQLCIEHHVLDYRQEFKKRVIDSFVDEYLKGRTPSPCIVCNEQLKFGMLLEQSSLFGAHLVATGHYAAITRDENGYHLRKGADDSKDQSYFLYRLKQPELSRLLFPVGALSKSHVRKLALERGLVTHEKPESQEICFVPGDDYVSFIESAAGERLRGPGNFVDLDGNVLGRHSGIHAYTIGQRRGLGFGIGKRQYVVAIYPVKNEVVLGQDEVLLKKQMLVKDVCWTNDDYRVRRSATVKIRSKDRGSSAEVIPGDYDSVRVIFDSPARAIAPGQAAVFYDGDEVLGGGWIEGAIDG